MVELLIQPPPAEAIAKMATIDGVRFTPTVLASQTGPDAHLGPEAAGPLVILQATFVDEERFGQFWLVVADLMEQLAGAPGFIRRFNFADGPHFTLLALWRSAADAHAFFSSEEHQAAMQELFRQRWQYSHFAGMWELAAPRRRLIFCQQCDGITPVSEGICAGCGTVLFDPFAASSHVDH